jgi:xeroderma pigmentosum group C-complementing protein
MAAPPTMWTEVFSRADCSWLPVDPIRAIVNKRKVFDPAFSSLLRKGEKIRNRMLYVMAFEEDSFARDVTARYAKDYGAKVAKMQRSGGVGNSRKEWWDRVVAMVQRPYRLVMR